MKESNATQVAARVARGSVLGLALLLVPGRADAYLDPGTGSMVLQATLATLMGALLVVKTYWQRIKSVFSKKDANAAEAEPRSPADGD